LMRKPFPLCQHLPLGFGSFAPGYVSAEHGNTTAAGGLGLNLIPGIRGGMVIFEVRRRPLPRHARKFAFEGRTDGVRKDLPVIPAEYLFTLHAGQPFGLRICISDTPPGIERNKCVGDALQQLRGFLVCILAGRGKLQCVSSTKPARFMFRSSSSIQMPGSLLRIYRWSDQKRPTFRTSIALSTSPVRSTVGSGNRFIRMIVDPNLFPPPPEQYWLDAPAAERNQGRSFH